MHVAHAHFPKHPVFLEGLDPFRDDNDAQSIEHRHQAFDDHSTRQTAVDAANQFHVELDDVRLKSGQQGEPGMPRTKIVQRGRKPHPAVRIDDVRDMHGILHLLVLGEFEDKSIGRKRDRRRRLQRQLDAGDWRIDRVRDDSTNDCIPKVRECRYALSRVGYRLDGRRSMLFGDTPNPKSHHAFRWERL